MQIMSFMPCIFMFIHLFLYHVILLDFISQGCGLLVNKDLIIIIIIIIIISIIIIMIIIIVIITI